MLLTKKQLDKGRALAHKQKRENERRKYLEIRKLRDSGMSQSEIARKLGMHRQSVSRIVLRNEKAATVRGDG